MMSKSESLFFFVYLCVEERDGGGKEAFSRSVFNLL